MKSFDCKQCKVSADRSIFLTNLFKKLSRGGQARTAEASVVSRRLTSARFPTPDNTWDRLVTFKLSDESQVELFTSEEQFQALSQGLQGMLTWEGDTLQTFEVKE